MASQPADYNPSSYSDVPLYNIQAVAAATGVPAITLRSWERRYGVPRPKRDPQGYRLYSDRDLAVTRWLRERVRQGVGISRAIHMLQAIEAGQLKPHPSRTLDFTALRAQLLEAIATMDESGVARVIAEALTVASVEEACLRLLQPALHDIGEQWADGRLSATCEHVGSNRLRAHLEQLMRLTPPPLREDTVLVGCAPGELHDIGALMLALFLRRRGFAVVYVGASIEPDSFIADACALQPAAICLSASTPATGSSLISLCKQMSASYAGTVGIGGQAFQDAEQLANNVPGTYLGPDAGEATKNLELILTR
jgi:methanogenic corrinoid protein MtbC1